MKQFIIVTFMIAVVILSACAQNDSTAETDVYSPTPSPDNPKGLTIDGTDPTPVGNLFFFADNDSPPVYQGLFIFDDTIEKDVILHIDEVADLSYGTLYELTLEPIEGVPDTCLSLGYFYVRQDTIYKINPTQADLNQLLAGEELPKDSLLVCQNEAIQDTLEEDEKGFHQYLDVNGDRREFHSYNNQVETGYYESYIWEKGKGLIYFKNGFGAGRASIELELIGIDSGQ